MSGDAHRTRFPGPDLRPPAAWIEAHSAPRKGDAPPSSSSSSASPPDAPATRDRRRRRTIRGRLVAGFGAALATLLASGALGVYAVTVVHRDLRASMT